MSEATALVLQKLAPERGRFLDFVRGRVGPSDAEDLLQVAMLRAALRAETLQNPDLVVPWFFRILRNVVADHYAKGGAGEHRVAPLDDAEEPATETAPDVCGCSLTLLSSLRPEYAEILRHVDLEEESLAEASEALAISPNNAAVRLHRARKALREALAVACGTESVRACMDCSCDA